MSERIVRFVTISERLTEGPADVLSAIDATPYRLAILTLDGLKGQEAHVDGAKIYVPIRWAQAGMGGRGWLIRHRILKAPLLCLGIKHAKRLGCLNDILSDIAAADPDVIDLRAVPQLASFAPLIKHYFPGRQLLTGSDEWVQNSSAENWRQYDADLSVSIVLPTYNGERFLAQSIESCLGQSHQQIELIIVNDCSTDKTLEICNFYSDMDKRVKVITNRINRGLPESLNIGHDACSGELLTWTSDDNLYMKNAIRYMVQQLCTYKGIAFVYCSQINISEDGKFRDFHLSAPAQELRARNVVRACFLYRKEVAKQVGAYRPEYRHVEDYDYWIRIATTFPSRHFYEPQYFYRTHSGSLTARHHERWHDLASKLRHEHFVEGRKRIIWTPVPSTLGF